MNDLEKVYKESKEPKVLVAKIVACMPEAYVNVLIEDSAKDLYLSNGELIGLKYQTPQAAGFDFFSDEDCVIVPGSIALVSTGVRMSLPIGKELQIRPRSGLALKHGITVLNSPGTIDSDYRGIIKVILFNAGEFPFVVTRGERICQGVIADVYQGNWYLSTSLEDTERGDGGFGHTGR